MEAVGIKESKELIVGIMHIAALLGARLKDGVQIDDFPAFMDGVKEDKAIEEAFKGLGGIPAEMKDLSVGEGFELSVAVLAEVPKIIAAVVK